jgi:hypothetical protein
MGHVFKFDFIRCKAATIGRGSSDCRTTPRRISATSGRGFTNRGFMGRYIFFTASNRQTSKQRPHLMQRDWSIKWASLRTPEMHVTGQFRAQTVQPTHFCGSIS